MAGTSTFPSFASAFTMPTPNKYLTTLLSTLFVRSAITPSGCSISPIYIDIHLRDVYGSQQQQYGSFISVGSPTQNQSFWPSLCHNETTLAQTGFCSPGSAQDCVNSTHGFFDPDKSSSWVFAPEYESLDNTSFSNLSLQYGSDTLHLYQHYSDPSPATTTDLSEFPIILLSNYTSPANPFFGPSSLLGLGPNSTLLTHLKSRNLVASRSYGLYLGTGYPSAADGGIDDGLNVNGSLTLGGYDANRFQGAVYSYNLSVPDNTSPSSTSASPSPNPICDEASAFKIQISQIKLTQAATGSQSASKADGTVREILLLDLPAGSSSSSSSSSSAGIDAYLTSAQSALTLPESVVRNFDAGIAALSSTSSSLSTATPPHPINLTITLSSGFSVTIPSTLLLRDSIAGRNTSNITSSSNSNIRISENGPYLLGTTFLSQVYLMTNYDSAAFYLAAAVPDSSYVSTVSFCSSSSSGSGGNFPTPQPATQQGGGSGFESRGLVGAVIGGVVGGIAVGVLVWTVCVKRWFRGRGDEKTATSAPTRRARGWRSGLFPRGWAGKTQPEGRRNYKGDRHGDEEECSGIMTASAPGAWEMIRR